jgi:hypothetical protein
VIYFILSLFFISYLSITALGKRIVQWLCDNPFKAIVLVSIIATTLSVTPVLFNGRSFVSPNYGTPLLYDEFPTLPETHYSDTQDLKGSDIGAIMWQHVPFSALQYRSIFKDKELPVWSRYNAGGTPLLAQGQSMFGDPLHLFVIALHGSSLAWDIKYILAKTLFSLALGLCVFLVTRHIWSSLFITLSSPYLGFFLFRVNHPAFFSLCYAPWVLYFYLKINQAITKRSLGLNLLGLMTANVSLLNSGTVKEAYMLLAMLILCGISIVLFSEKTSIPRFRKLGFVILSGLFFCMISIPFWRTFLDTLKVAFTHYEHPFAAQISPFLIIGFFDEAFYRPLIQGEQIVYPSSNLALLIGILLYFSTIKYQIKNRVVLILTIVSLLPFSLAFGIIPHTWIESTPFLKNIGHVGNTFTCVLIILSSVTAGQGLASAFLLFKNKNYKSLVLAFCILTIFLFLYFTYFKLYGNPNQILSPFIKGYLTLSLTAVVTFILGLHYGISRSHFSLLNRFILGIALCMLLWRFAQYTKSPYSDYLVQPTHRVKLDAKSQAISYILDQQKISPSRAIGLQGNLWSGWSTYYALEGINAPDALINPRYHELLYATHLEQQWIWRLFLTRPILPDLKPILDFLNVKYYLDLRSDQGELGKLLTKDLIADLDVYHSTSVWPRAFFTDQIAKYDSINDLLALVKQEKAPFAAIDTTDLNYAPYLSKLIHYTISNRIVIPATDYSLTENSTQFKIQTPRTGIIILSEVLWPGYPHATIDGKETKVFRINHAFQGLSIDPGIHTIVVTYRPKGFNTNLILSIISSLAFLITISYLVVSKDRNFLT